LATRYATELVQFIGSDAQLSIWRRYDTVSSHNLLHLEAELQLLEFKIQELDREDFKSNEESTRDERSYIDDAGRCWEVLVKQAETGNKSAEKRQALDTKLKASLKEYSRLKDQVWPRKCH
jgi:putative sterol carrier protein